MAQHSDAEAHTPATDRAFRPDVEGLRAVAVAMVVLYHADLRALSGGYVGVDVFFVLSGFLITGLLIRERLRRNSTSILGFYARRARRILPAATVVLIVTVAASYRWLGFLRAGVIAHDGQWTSVFAANLHFASQGTQYLNFHEPPSPLQHYWSLAVEEQFYLVWPLLFLTVAAIGQKLNLRTKLITVLVTVIAASFAWSIIQTNESGVWAFFSPLTRAWELSVGALLAVGEPALMRMPHKIGTLASGSGLIIVVASGFLLNAGTAFPGYAAALPVLGSAMVVAGGTVAPGKGAELVLRGFALRWLGKLSYSLYLWHWPILTIAAERSGRHLSHLENLVWVIVALALAFITYHVIENPCRYSRVFAEHPVNSMVGGLCLVFASFSICTWQIQRHETHRRKTIRASSQVLTNGSFYDGLRLRSDLPNA